MAGALLVRNFNASGGHLPPNKENMHGKENGSAF